MRTIHRKISNYEDAEDICHEVFVNLYKKFDEITEYRAWLNKAINFAVSNYLRDHKPKHEISIDQTNIESFNNTDENHDTKLIIEDIINSKDTMNEKEYMIFDLVGYKKFSYTQAAKELGMSKRQVEYAYKQTCKRIMDSLKEKGIHTIGDIA